MAAVGGGGLPAYALRRLLLAVPTLFAVLTIVFVLARVLPGDPAQTILGDQASQEALTSMRRAGADAIISYHAKDAAVWLRSESVL